MANFLKRWFTGVKTHTEIPTELDTYIQDRLIAIQERMGLEHQTFVNSDLDMTKATASGRHIPGAIGACAVGTTAPASPVTGSIYFNTTVGKFYVYNGSTWVTETPPAEVPRYTIFAYFGVVPPTGYAVCNGGNGTPDLRGKFILASTTLYPINSTGGNINMTHRHTLVQDSPTHSHTVTIQQGSDPVGAVGTSTQSTERTYSPTSYETLYPPYYSLTYIMKL